MVALTQEQFDELIEDIPDDAFKELVPKLMEAFAQKEGYDLTRIEVAALCERLLGMADTIEHQVNHIGELQKEIQEWEQKEKKGLWTPPK